jgi:hypothetical protein
MHPKKKPQRPHACYPTPPHAHEPTQGKKSSQPDETAKRTDQIGKRNGEQSGTRTHATCVTST